MGSKLIYPVNSEKYKTIVDEEIFELIEAAYKQTEQVVRSSRLFVFKGSEVLKKKGLIRREELLELLERTQNEIRSQEEGFDYVIDLDNSDCGDIGEDP